MSLPTSWTTVTPLSKTIAMIFFILFPLLGFFYGVRYQQKLDALTMMPMPEAKLVVPTPSIPATWLIYTSKNFRLSIQYPSTWDVPTEKYDLYGINQIKIINRNILNSVDYYEEDKRANPFFITIKKTPVYQSLAEILTSANSESNGAWKDVKYKTRKLSVGGQPAVEIYNQGVTSNTDSVFVIYKNTQYAIALYHDQLKASPDATAVFTYILSTVKFL